MKNPSPHMPVERKRAWAACRYFTPALRVESNCLLCRYKLSLSAD